MTVLTKNEIAIDLSLKIMCQMVDAATTGTKATIIYIGKFEMNHVNELKDLGVATYNHKALFLYGVRAVTVNLDSHCVAYV